MASSQETQINDQDLLKLITPTSPSLLEKRTHKNQQTDSAAVGVDHALILQQHVHFLRDLLNVRSSDVLERWKTPKLTVAKQDARAKGKSVCRKLCMNDEATPLSSSYILRYSCQERKITDSVENLINYVQNEIKHAHQITENWTGSIMELTIDTLIRISESNDSQISRELAKLTNNFLKKIINETEINQASHLEAVSNIVLKLCDSPEIADNVIDQIIQILADGFEHVHGNELIKWITFLENSPYIIHILVIILKRFDSKFDANGNEWKARPKTDTTVLNLWRNLARTTPKSPTKTTNRFLQRHEKLEFLLMTALTTSPYLSAIIMEATETCRKIFTAEPETPQYSTTNLP